MNPVFPAVRHGLSAGLLLLPASALALPLDPVASDTPWLAGAQHPFLDVNHVATLLVLGIAAALLGRRSRWGVPMMVCILMGAGIVLGTQGAVAPMLNTIVLTTGLCLVLLLLGHVHLIFATVTSVAGAFALFHGVADGFQMMQAHVALSFIIGYAVSTLVVLAAGVGLGEWIHRHYNVWSERARNWYTHIHGMRLRS